MPPPPVLFGDGEREEGIINADDAFFLDVDDAALKMGSTKSATAAGHAEAPAAVASTTRTILSGASEEEAAASALLWSLPPFFAGGVGAVFEVRAIRKSFFL